MCGMEHAEHFLLLGGGALANPIEEQCKTLCKQQWHELCEDVEGQLRSGKRRGNLKHLDQGSTRSSQRRSLARAIHLATDSTPDEVVVNKLIDKCLRVADSSAPTQFPDYAGCDVEELVQDFSVAEIRQVLFFLNGKSAPGPNGVTNKMLENLDDESIDFLTKKVNEIGVHNTPEEIIEAQERSQLLKLSGTKSGRKILDEMGVNSIDQCPDAVRILRDISKHIEASFVDAAAYVLQEAFAVSIVDSNSRVTCSATVRTSKPVIAKEVAIALAMLDSRR
ncbi:hypothetical protein MTO96_028596 [Rhipicephalus appendiculatus]